MNSYNLTYLLLYAKETQWKHPGNSQQLFPQVPQYQVCSAQYRESKIHVFHLSVLLCCWDFSSMLYLVVSYKVLFVDGLTPIWY